MNIAIIAWGSLIWDPRTLQITGKDWPRNGPVLNLEFSRISLDARLTLVIDDTHGVLTSTWTNASARDSLPDAIANLQERERMPNSRRVGFVDAQSGRSSEWARLHQPVACKVISEWVAKEGFDAAIWTALPSNFAEKAGKPFSPKAALAYLQGLHGDTQQNALQYIRGAPAEVLTPVRHLVNAAFEQAPPA